MEAERTYRRLEKLEKWEGPLLAILPVVLVACMLVQIDQSALIAVGAAVVVLVAYFLIFEFSRPSLRQIMPAVVLAALAVAGRLLFAPFPDFKPMAAICIIAGCVFGRRCGFMTGTLCMLVSNFFFGHGPWTPWQMYAYGCIGWISGWLETRMAFTLPDGKPRRWALYCWAVVAALGYGLLLNTWHIVGYIHPITWQSALLTYGLGLQTDIVQVVATIVFLAALYEPWRKKLYRIQRKYDLG